MNFKWKEEKEYSILFSDNVYIGGVFYNSNFDSWYYIIDKNVFNYNLQYGRLSKEKCKKLLISEASFEF